VAAAFITSGLPVARPVYTSSSGKRVPAHPVLLARRVWPEVEKLRGDEGARVLLRAHPEWLFAVQIEGEPPVDIDTGEDYQQALSRSD
jgi:molybdenum cofactor cytidylyltransferase